MSEASSFLTGEFAKGLARSIELGRITPVALLCCTHYDETPLSIRVEKQNIAASVGSRRQIRQLNVSKVLQTDGRIAFLVHDGSGYTCLRLGIPCPLQVMDHTTAENLKACLGKIWSSSPPLLTLMDLFPQILHLHLSTHDRV